MKNGTVVVLSPMDSECELLISKLENKTEKQFGGYRLFEGTINNLPTVIVRCLIGTVNAAVCTAYIIEHYSPRCIILQGTAGAHDIKHDRNDIIIAEKIFSITNIVSPTKKIGEGSNPFEWEDFGVQYYSKQNDIIDFSNFFYSDKNLVETAKRVPYGFGKVIVGTVGCGDVWNKEADLILHYNKTKGTDCEAMEGVGVAQVCASFGVPMIEIRVISNNELRENEHFLVESATNCQKFVLDFLNLL